MLGIFSGGLDVLHHRAKFGEDRTTRAGCRCENVVFVRFNRYRMPQSCKLPVVNLRTGQKSGFSPRRGDSIVAPIHVKLGRADGHVGPLGCAEFHLNRRRWWECGPKI